MRQAGLSFPTQKENPKKMGKNTKVNKHIEIMKPLQKYVFSMYTKSKAKHSMPNFLPFRCLDINQKTRFKAWFAKCVR